MSLRELLKCVLGLRKAYRVIIEEYKKLKSSRNKTPREKFIKNSRDELRIFFKKDLFLTFSDNKFPDISVVIPVFNKAEFTFQCLKQLSKIENCNFEVIVINNASKDMTKKLLSRVKNIKVISNSKNLHFLKASNQGAFSADGRFILFLNNDTVPETNSLINALKTIELDSGIGVVGGKLVYPDNTLQEAGSIIWSDGSTIGYIRGKDPLDSEFQFRRSVDYCSGAFLLTRTDLFKKLNGFDEEFSPAYFEDVDYCIRVQREGYKVVYEPTSVITHIEFGSSFHSRQAVLLMEKNQKKLAVKHKEFLNKKHTKDFLNIYKARSNNSYKGTVLYVDERLPHIKTGAGYPRANSIVHALKDKNYFVSVYPLIYVDQNESWETVYEDISRDIEVLAIGSYKEEGFKRFIESRPNYYDIIFISRPTTMKALRKITPDLKLFCNSKIVYDAEALFSLRDVQYKKLLGEVFDDQTVDKLVEEETRLAKGINAVSSVSPLEASYFKKAGVSQVEVISFSHELKTTKNSFEQREGILFVGAIHGNGGPNYDSVIWFSKKIFPIIKSKGLNCKFYIVGTNHSKDVAALESEDIKVIGAVQDLSEWFNKCRVFVAPTRFSAGIPHKVTEASSHGIPTVLTGLLHSQLSWLKDEEYLVGENAEDFALKVVEIYNNKNLWDKIRCGVINKIKSSYSKEAFEESVCRVVN